MITLYDDVFSPYARKVRMALYEKGLDVERVRALHDCNRTDFVHVNPRAEVPALVDGDVAIYDSTVICEYLEERYPTPPLYPCDAAARARCRLIEDLADTQLDAALYAITLVEFGRHESHPAMRAAAGQDIARLYDALEQALGGAPFFGGGLSVADLAVLPHAMYAQFFGFEMDAGRHPALRSWFVRMQERPSVARDNADVFSALEQIQAGERTAFDPWHVQWRSDRLEWVMKHGFADWFRDEMAAGRAFFPLARQPV